MTARHAMLVEAVVRCYDLMVERRTPGSRVLYEAVVEAWVALARPDPQNP